MESSSRWRLDPAQQSQEMQPLASPQRSSIHAVLQGASPSPHFVGHVRRRDGASDPDSDPQWGELNPPPTKAGSRLCPWGSSLTWGCGVWPGVSYGDEQAGCGIDRSPGSRAVGTKDAPGRGCKCSASSQLSPSLLCATLRGASSVLSRALCASEREVKGELGGSQGATRLGVWGARIWGGWSEEMQCCGGGWVALPNVQSRI